MNPDKYFILHSLSKSEPSSDPLPDQSSHILTPYITHVINRMRSESERKAHYEQGGKDAVHPIQRYPTDVLQCIFEWVIVDHPHPLRAAIDISHVCRCWRTIALDTPTLWADIILSMNSRLESLVAIWKNIPRRIKNAPVRMIIGDLDKHNGDILYHFSLDQIPHFERLFIYCKDGENVPQLVDPRFSIPTGKVDELSIVFDVEKDSVLGTPIWTLNQLLDRFPPVHTLVVTTESEVYLTPLKEYPSVKSLTINASPLVYIDIITRSFPNLEILQLGGCAIYNTGLSADLTQLSSLLIIGSRPTEDDWMARLRCPSLIQYNYFDNSPWQWSTGFIASHRSLNTLYLLNPVDLPSLRSCCPQIKTLAINNMSKELYDPYDPLFLELEHLIVFECNHWMETEGFDTLVRGRVLPRSHPQCLVSESVKPLRRLLLLGTSPPSEILSWAKSELFKSAQYEIAPGLNGLWVVDLQWT